MARLALNGKIEVEINKIGALLNRCVCVFDMISRLVSKRERESESEREAHDKSMASLMFISTVLIRGDLIMTSLAVAEDLVAV